VPRRSLRSGFQLGAAAGLIATLAVPITALGQRPKVGSPAPDFTLSDLQGDSTRLSQWRGHPVVLKFWASWCPTCRTEIPELLAAREAHVHDGLVVLTVDSDDKASRIPKFLSTIPGSDGLPVLLDPKRRVQGQYRIPLLPTTMFIDSTGVVRGIHAGALSREDLEAGLHAIL